MKIIDPYTVIGVFSPTELMKSIEIKARLCYKSEERITDVSHLDLIKMLVARGHWPMFDHQTVSVKFVIDRGISHEIVRHRIGVAYAQESTRYCNY